MVGRTAGNRNALADKCSGAKKNRKLVRGYHFVHTAIDAHSRPSSVDVRVVPRPSGPDCL